MRPTFLTSLVGAVGLGSGCWVSSNRERRAAALELLSGSARFARTAAYSALTAADYKWHLRGIEYGTCEWRAVATTVHQRAADRLLYVCRLHGGLYVKLGQYVSSMNHVLPPEYTSTLASLLDNAKPMSPAQVHEVLSAEFSGDGLFAEISEEPVACASLAQVHRGVLRDGSRPVAIKLQYPWLEAQVASDTRTLKMMVRALGMLFPDLAYAWILPEFEENMRLELDFRQEARNSRRLRKQLRHRRDVHVPLVLPGLTTRRATVMEWIEGVKLESAESMEAAGFDARAVAATVSQTFGEMIHVHGFVHCDPHAGNLLVRKAPGGHGHQLVVLDHGMYRRLDPAFRRHYCKLWRALLLRDTEGGRRVVELLGMRRSDYDVLSLLFTFRAVDSTARLGQRMGQVERRRVRSRYTGRVSAEKVNAFLQRLPRDVLFVLRCQTIVRSLNKALGGTSRDRFHALGLAAVRGLHVGGSTPAPAVSPPQGGKLPYPVGEGGSEDWDALAHHPINLPTDSELLAEAEASASAGSVVGVALRLLRLRVHVVLRIELLSVRFRLALVDVLWSAREWWQQWQQFQ